MPNHVYLIVCIDWACRDAACHVSTVKNEKTKKWQKMLGSSKLALTTYANLNKTKFGWQTRFHNHIIRNQEEMSQIATYIEKNPVHWEKDKSNSELVVSSKQKNHSDIQIFVNG